MPILGGSPPTPRQIVAPLSVPTSGATVLNDSGINLTASLTVTLSPTALLNSTVTVEISEDGSAWTTYATVGIPAGGITLAGSTHQILMMVPTSWYYRVTATRAVVNSLVAMG